MTGKLVSIIVPFYKSETTIRATIESLIGQTYKNLEIILVNDGSPDRARSVAEEYTVRDNRLRIIDQENRGCYEARLTGFKAAKGAYITSVDSDDTIEPGMIKTLVEMSERHNLDVVECDFDGAKPGEDEIYLGREMVLRKILWPRLIEGRGLMCVCGKLYRNIFDWSKIEHHRVTIFEDIVFNIQLLSNVGRYGYVHMPMYNYNINVGSSVRNFNDKYVCAFGVVKDVRRRNLHNYDVEPSDSINLTWERKNLRNMIVLAATANGLSVSESATFVRKLLGSIRYPKVLVTLIRISFLLKTFLKKGLGK